MSKLYFMRHGQTLFNLLRRKQGWCDSPLTELGIEQAKTVGATLRGRGLTFDHAYSSTSERACDTLELASPVSLTSASRALRSGTLANLRARARI